MPSGASPSIPRCPRSWPTAGGGGGRRPLRGWARRAEVGLATRRGYESEERVGQGQAAVTGRERIVAAYKGGYADCVPAYPIAGSFAGCLDGLSIEEYCTNPTKAVRAMLNYYERYQPDIMVAFNDLAKEAEAVGCRVKYSDYVVPSIDQHVPQGRTGR